mmetsp:Transcript_16867/g.45698  ORF Transcript_16867/g.45698 Transcript_16867/m.45698 type:complete len:229 (+) Transcript_16867:54-740(+)
MQPPMCSTRSGLFLRGCFLCDGGMNLEHHKDDHCDQVQHNVHPRKQQLSSGRDLHLAWLEGINDTTKTFDENRDDCHYQKCVLVGQDVRLKEQEEHQHPGQNGAKEHEDTQVLDASESTSPMSKVETDVLQHGNAHDQDHLLGSPPFWVLQRVPLVVGQQEHVESVDVRVVSVREEQLQHPRGQILIVWIFRYQRLPSLHGLFHNWHIAILSRHVSHKMIPALKCWVS